MGGQNVNSVAKFSPEPRIFSPEFCIFGRHLSDKKQIFVQAKKICWDGVPLPPLP